MKHSDEDLMNAYQLGDAVAMQHIFEHNKNRLPYSRREKQEV